jgi:hypothetical protein
VEIYTPPTLILIATFYHVLRISLVPDFSTALISGMYCCLVEVLVATVDSTCGVRSSAGDLVGIVAIVVASVDGLLGTPVLGVQSAVGTEGHTVLGQDVAGEEVAWLVVAVGVGEVLLVERGLGVAGGGAELRVVGTVVEETHTVVGVVVLAVLLDERCVDGSLEVLRGVEAGHSGGILAVGVELGVTVAADNDNVELLAPLALVGGRCLGNGVAVDRALDVGDGLGVRAAGSGVDTGVTLVEDVETQAERLAVAEFGALLDIVVARFDDLVGQVTDLLSRAKFIAELLLVAGRSGSLLSLLPQGAVN